MSGAAAKRRRQEFRRRVAAIGRVDRFTERMEHLKGARPCIWCDLVRPVSELSEQGICTTCLRVWRSLPSAQPRREDLRVRVERPNAVYVDASYRHGVAGLAVCGALGEHSKRVQANGSNEAEVRALKWALLLAAGRQAVDLVFVTDSQSAYCWFVARGRRSGWTVEQVPRRHNQRADHLARQARLAESGASKETTG